MDADTASKILRSPRNQPQPNIVSSPPFTQITERIRLLLQSPCPSNVAVSKDGNDCGLPFFGKKKDRLKILTLTYPKNHNKLRGVRNKEQKYT